jgi:hypothetical protein
MPKSIPPLTDKQTVDFMLAEYSTLRESRHRLESVGENRVNFFLAIVSGAIVGLGLVNQLPGPTDIIYFVNIAIFISIFLLGLITFARMVERSINDIQYARAMNRIRRYFVDRNTTIEKYLWFPITDDKPSLHFSVFNFKTRRLSMIGLAPMIAIVNSMIALLGLSLLARVVWNLQIGWSLIIGIIAFVIVISAQFSYQASRIKAKNKEIDVHFPSIK